MCFNECRARKLNFEFDVINQCNENRRMRLITKGEREIAGNMWKFDCRVQFIRAAFNPSMVANLKCTNAFGVYVRLYTVSQMQFVIA